MDDRDERIAYAAYWAWCAHFGWTPIAWKDMAAHEQELWASVAEAVSKEVGGIY